MTARACKLVFRHKQSAPLLLHVSAGFAFYNLPSMETAFSSPGSPYGNNLKENGINNWLVMNIPLHYSSRGRKNSLLFRSTEPTRSKFIELLNIKQCMPEKKHMLGLMRQPDELLTLIY